MTDSVQRWLVITDEGVYSSYAVHAYVCDEMQARRIGALRKDVQRIIREHRIGRPTDDDGDSLRYHPTPQAWTGFFTGYLDYEDVRLIQQVGGTPLFDDLTDKSGVDGLIAQYERIIATALPPKPKERP